MNLIAEFSERLSSKMVDRGIVPKEDVDLYRYGIENGIVVMGNFLTSVVFGIITGRLGFVLVFLLFCITLRSFSGGIHSKNRLTCFTLSLIVLLIPVYTFSYFFKVVQEPCILIIGILSFFIIWILSPVESENKPLDEVEKKVYKKKSRWMVTVQVLILLLLYLLNLKGYFYAGYSSMVMIAISMVFGKIYNKKKRLE